jgi:N6-adenosine-specific RNA methylase IME4
MKYRTIVADPPWPYEDGFSTQSRTNGKWDAPFTRKPLPYAAMSLGDIRSLPVGTLAAADCRLFLWTTNRHLPDAFTVLVGWGFRYRQLLVWHKRDGNMGGSVAPTSAEFLIVATRGTPERLAKMPSAVISTAQPKRHSTKPDIWIDYIEQVSPGPYVELFSRRHRLGWDVWGNESANTATLEGAS